MADNLKGRRRPDAGKKAEPYFDDKTRPSDIYGKGGLKEQQDNAKTQAERDVIQAMIDARNAQRQKETREGYAKIRAKYDAAHPGGEGRYPSGTRKR